MGTAGRREDGRGGDAPPRRSGFGRATIRPGRGGARLAGGGVEANGGDSAAPRGAPVTAIEARGSDFFVEAQGGRCALARWGSFPTAENPTNGWPANLDGSVGRAIRGQRSHCPDGRTTRGVFAAPGAANPPLMHWVSSDRQGLLRDAGMAPGPLPPGATSPACATSPAWRDAARGARLARRRPRAARLARRRDFRRRQGRPRCGRRVGGTAVRDTLAPRAAGGYCARLAGDCWRPSHRQHTIDRHDEIRDDAPAFDLHPSRRCRGRPAGGGVARARRARTRAGCHPVAFAGWRSRTRAGCRPVSCAGWPARARAGRRPVSCAGWRLARPRRFRTCVDHRSRAAATGLRRQGTHGGRLFALADGRGRGHLERRALGHVGVPPHERRARRREAGAAHPEPRDGARHGDRGCIERRVLARREVDRVRGRLDGGARSRPGPGRGLDGGAVRGRSVRRRAVAAPAGVRRCTTAWRSAS